MRPRRPLDQGHPWGERVKASGRRTTVAIVDYGSGNLRSVAKAFERMASEHEKGTRIIVTSDPAVVRSASRIVLPVLALSLIVGADSMVFKVWSRL